jgi:hypothetical protein
MTPMTSAPTPTATRARYAKCIDASKRVRWEIERDVIRGRRFDLDQTFLPDGLSRVDGLAFLSVAEARFLSQVQGRTYANMFGLVERYIASKTITLAQRHALGDQVAFEALVRMTDEELKHQALFRRLEEIAAAQMPAGYRFEAQPDDVAGAVLGAGDWAVLGLTLHIELFTLTHYRASIEHQTGLCPLWRDVFLFHWKEESQHAILDDLEWRRVHDGASAAERDRGVDELIALVGAVDGILQGQARTDADYFLAHLGRALAPTDDAALRRALLAAYRWQYIVSGAREPRFTEVLAELTTAAQMARIGAALAPLIEAAQ